jgi:hypothetical protein
VIPSSQQIQPATNGATDEASVSTPSRSLILGVVAHSLKAGFAWTIDVGAGGAQSQPHSFEAFELA